MDDTARRQVASGNPVRLFGDKLPARFRGE
jgi:hypothetical protein